MLRRRLDIQGLRAVAVLAVIVHHAGIGLPGGFLGVDVFFAISGYVITGVLLDAGGRPIRETLTAFYVRRFRRLTPALAATVTFTVIVSVFLLSFYSGARQAALTGAGAMLLSANIVISTVTGGYFEPAAELNPLLHTWSLSVEEQFYLLYPIVILGVTALIAGKVARKRRFLGLAIAALSAASLVVLAWGLLFHPTSALIGYYSPIGRVWEFGFGALAFILSRFAPRLGKSSGQLVAASALLVVIASFLLIRESDTTPGPTTLVPVVATSVLLWAGVAPNRVSGGLLSWRPMVFIGDISYSWYLWHWPLIVFATVLVPGSGWIAAILSIGPAVASYYWLENPLRRGWPHRRAPALALAGLVFFVPISASVVSYYLSHELIPTSDAMRDSLAARSGCFNGVPLPIDPVLEIEDCTFNGDAPGRPIYLVGDSNAAQFSDGLLLAATELDRPLVINTSSGCPFPSMPSSFRPDDQEACQLLNSATAEYLSTAEPGTVVIANADLYTRIQSIAFLGTGATDEAIKLEFYVEAESAAIRRLTESEHSVVLAEIIPNFNTEENTVNEAARHCALPFQTILNSCEPYAEALTAISQRQAAGWEAQARISDSTGAALFSVRSKLCPDGICSYGTIWNPTYRDRGHLSALASESLAPDWIAILSN